MIRSAKNEHKQTRRLAIRDIQRKAREKINTDARRDVLTALDLLAERRTPRSKTCLSGERVHLRNHERLEEWFRMSRMEIEEFEFSLVCELKEEM